MATTDRWKKAQAYERAYWENAGRQIKQGERSSLSFYEWRAKNLQEILAKALPEGAPSLADKTVVEVGCAAVGTISFVEAKERFAFDPLNDFYESIPELVECRNPDVKYMTSKGEELPAEDGIADLTIMENVIDHVQNDAAVMNELNRVTKPGGLLFFTVNLHPAWGKVLHEVIARLRIDPGHPHTFSLPKVQRYLPKYGFEILYSEYQDYKVCRAEDFNSASRKDKIKAVTGLSEFLFTAVCRKKAYSGSQN